MSARPGRSISCAAELGQIRTDSSARIRELESLANEQKAQISVLERMVDQLRLKPNVRAVRNAPMAEPESDQTKLVVIPGTGGKEAGAS